MSCSTTKLSISSHTTFVNTKITFFSKSFNNIYSSIGHFREIKFTMQLSATVPCQGGLYYITPELTVLQWLNVYGWRYAVGSLGNFNC